MMKCFTVSVISQLPVTVYESVIDLVNGEVSKYNVRLVYDLTTCRRTLLFCSMFVHQHEFFLNIYVYMYIYVCICIYICI